MKLWRAESLLDFDVEVGVEGEVKVRAPNYFFGVGGWLCGWKGGWVAEYMENKAIFQLEVVVEVKVEFGAWQHKEIDI